jgi:hypothetical protein
METTETETESTAPVLNGELLALGGKPIAWDGDGLVIPEGTTMEEISSLLKGVAFFKSNMVLVLSDSLSYALQQGWEDQLQLALEESHLLEADVTRAMAIAKVPRGMRAKGLTDEHYFVVSSLERGDQARWLKVALEHRLTGFELKRSIEAGKILKKKDLEALSGRGSGIPNYQAAILDWKRWTSQIGGSENLATWPTDSLKKFLADVGPIRDTIAAAEEELEKRS